MGQKLSSEIRKWCHCCLAAPLDEQSPHHNNMQYQARSSSLNHGNEKMPMVQVEVKDVRQNRRGLAWMPNQSSLDSSSDGHGHEVEEAVVSVMGEVVIFKYFYRSNQSIDMDKGIMLIET